MVLYQVYHCGFLGQIITHRLTKYPNENAILLAGNRSPIHFGSYTEVCKNFVESGLFDQFFCYDEFLGIGTQSSEGDVEQAILAGYDKHFHKIGLDIKTFKTIVISFDGYNSFGIYLSLKGIKHSIINVSSDIFIRHHSQYNRLKKMNPDLEAYFNVCYKHFASASLITRPEPTLRSQFKDHDKNTKHEFFDEISSIQGFCGNDIQKILSAFNLDNDMIYKSGKVLIVPYSTGGLNVESKKSHNAIQKRYSIDNQYHLIHQYLFDYYLPDKNIVIKPHPSIPLSGDILNLYYAGRKCFPALFPMEFIPIIKADNENSVYDTAVIGSFTGKSKTAGLARNLLFVSHEFYTRFYILNRIYVTFSMLRELFPELIIKLRMNDDSVLVKEFSEYAMNFEQDLLVEDNTDCFTDTNTAYILNDHGGNSYETLARLMNAAENSMVFFLDSNEKFYEFLHEHGTLHQFIVQITIKKIKLNIAPNLELCLDERLYVFCKNKHNRKKIMKFTMKKRLKSVGIDLQITPKMVDIF